MSEEYDIETEVGGYPNPKLHKGCGGEVVFREPENELQAHYSRAGWCLRCDCFPIDIEDIELDQNLIRKSKRKIYTERRLRGFRVLTDFKNNNEDKK